MRIFLAAFLFSLLACNHPEDNRVVLQHQIDSLRSRTDSAYAPGLGEFMLSIQIHHAKLWFAGKNGNWELADFELAEIQEVLEDIRKYCKERTEINELPMINQPLDSLKSTIILKNIESFKSSFKSFTNTCNNCHQATKHGFNVIKIPDAPPFTNQVFELTK